MEQFWDKHHGVKDVYWLSATYDGYTILNLHGIDTNITGLTVLDIGIGVGNLSRYLHSKGNIVNSCDISRIALENVKSFATTFHTSELSQIEPVDLAISNLVFQHCNDDEIEA